MHATASTPDSMLQAAIEAMGQGGGELRAALDRFPVPIYATNPQGTITHYNRPCVAFAGRTPRVGEDRWCVTWKLYTDQGQFLPHDKCPMAVAIHEKRAVRGSGAVAERPDGTRVRFMPYPTPLLDERDNLLGAVNLLVEVGAREQVQALRAQAAKDRRLASAISDKQALSVLAVMAAEYDEKALRLEQAG